MQMRKIYPVIIFISTVILLLHSCTKDQGRTPGTPGIPDTYCDSVVMSYSVNIGPLIQNSGCSGSSSCHFIGSPQGDFTAYEGLKEKVDNGSLRKRVFEGNPSFMPPAGILPDSSLKMLDCWIKSGAPNN